eukprot:CAMPEP_0172716936 /NCGR_PEP_ID=MMETSP1074-20121228/69816_1 /TAXON_ID=2916 /ORGANISM="Ceratium fusus, Strain PA161109" /LENGTH=46 /DNA_ID= /DNA_START= /DNA_END= /DNA_ORIENTATION=
MLLGAAAEAAGKEMDQVTTASGAAAPGAAETLEAACVATAATAAFA